MLRWLFSAHHNMLTDSTVSLLKIDEKDDDTFFGQRAYVKRAAHEGVDFNDLTPTGKQAALSLAQDRLVKFEERDGRTFVVIRQKSPIVDFLTIGLAP